MCVKKVLYKLLYAPDVNPLPFGIMSTLFGVLLFNAMTTTMVFSYLPELVLSFGYSEVEKGKYAGIVASSMFVSSIFFSFVWGYFADLKGKKLILITTCLGASAASLAFGFSTNLYWAIITRFLQGAFGVQVAAQVMLFGICDDTNKPIAMTVCLSAYSAGLVLGPSIGGYLAFPVKQYPGVFYKDSIFGKYKILLPNITLCCGFMFYALLLLVIIPPEKRKTYQILQNSKINNSDRIKDESEDITKNVKKSDLRLLLRNKLCWSICLLYALFQAIAIGFNELYPVWASTKRKYNGLNLSTSEIGTTLMAAAGVLIFVQPFFLARVADKFGVRKVFGCSLLVQAFLYPSYPIISLINNKYVMWSVLCLDITLTRMAVGASFMSASVMINDSVPSDLIGSANGLGITLGGITRAISPTIFGSIFSWSLHNIKHIPENKHPYGFPLNQYFVFLIMAVIAVWTAYFISLLPNQQRTKSNNKNENSDSYKVVIADVILNTSEDGDLIVA